MTIQTRDENLNESTSFEKPSRDNGCFVDLLTEPTDDNDKWLILSFVPFLFW